MATLQYIGARYVPKFATPYEWDINATYEALTIVGYQGNSYTSKIPVPAGTQISDDKYWALTNSQSGSVSNLETRMSSAETEIDSLQTITDSITDDVTNNAAAIAANTKAIQTLSMTAPKLPGMKNVIIIADSLGNHPTPATSWTAQLSTLLDLEPENVVIRNNSGAGFGVAGSAGEKYEQAIANIAKEKTVEWCKNVTHIIVGGGGNQARTPKETCVAGMDAFTQAWRTNFPNAECYLGLQARWEHDREASLIDDNTTMVKDMWLEGGAKNGFTWLTGTQESLYALDMFKTDGIHPNEKGAKSLADRMYCCLRSGTVHTSTPLTPMPWATAYPDLDTTRASGARTWEYIEDGIWNCVASWGGHGMPFKEEKTYANNMVLTRMNSAYTRGGHPIYFTSAYGWLQVPGLEGMHRFSIFFTQGELLLYAPTIPAGTKFTNLILPSYRMQAGLDVC